KGMRAFVSSIKLGLGFLSTYFFLRFVMLIVAERKRLGQLVKKSILGWRKMKQAFAILILLRRSEGNGKATICL
ncbi:hypothetical protein SFC81_18360, partial [Enterococcus faecalis]